MRLCARRPIQRYPRVRSSQRQPHPFSCPPRSPAVAHPVHLPIPGPSAPPTPPSASSVRAGNGVEWAAVSAASEGVAELPAGSTASARRSADRDGLCAWTQSVRTGSNALGGVLACVERLAGSVYRLPDVGGMGRPAAGASRRDVLDWLSTPRIPSRCKDCWYHQLVIDTIELLVDGLTTASRPRGIRT